MTFGLLIQFLPHLGMGMLWSFLGYMLEEKQARVTSEAEQA